MFLVQISLDAKRAEIRKLEERQQREEALRKSEQMLQEDEMRFEEFLKDNAQNAEQAMKKAERDEGEAEKVQEIKKLNNQIAQIKAEMSKFEEQLEDCRKYKEFLDKLTPPEWFDEQHALRLSRRTPCPARAAQLPTPARPPLTLPARRAQEKRKAAKVALRQKAAEEEARAAAEAAAGGGEEAKKRGGAEGQGGGGGGARARSTAVAVAIKRNVSDGRCREEREMPMYFAEPQQLLDIFRIGGVEPS